MKIARISMFYLVGYLLPAGVLLLVAPRFVFETFQSSQPESYGDVIPRVAGALAIALGLIVGQIIRFRLEMMHSTLVGVRVFLVGTWIWLYTRTHDPFFLILAAIVGFGAALTAVGLAVDKREST